MLKNEYRIYSMAYTLKIPYHYMYWIHFMTFKQMSTSSSAPCPLSEFNLEVGRRLLQFARNVYFKQKSSKNLKYFYRYLLPQCCIIPPFYFERVSKAFQSPAEKKCSTWDVAKVKSLWQDKTLEFKQHLFQLIMRIISSDYARHLNHRGGFLPNAADVPYMYTHTVVGESFKGQYHMEDLARHFHHTIHNAIFMKDPPFPDMWMLSFHTTMVLIENRFDRDFWKFTSHFKEVYRQDIR